MRRAEALAFLEEVLDLLGDDASGIEAGSLLGLAFIGDDVTGYLPVGNERELQLLVCKLVLASTRRIAAVECPSWCQLDVGHPFDEVSTGGGLLERTHERDFGLVRVVQDERAVSAAGPIERSGLSATALLREEGSPARLSEDECRELAANLLEAADVMHEHHA